MKDKLIKTCFFITCTLLIFGALEISRRLKPEATPPWQYDLEDIRREGRYVGHAIAVGEKQYLVTARQLKEVLPDGSLGYSINDRFLAEIEEFQFPEMKRVSRYDAWVTLDEFGKQLPGLACSPLPSNRP